MRSWPARLGPMQSQSFSRCGGVAFHTYLHPRHTNGYDKVQIELEQESFLVMALKLPQLLICIPIRTEETAQAKKTAKRS